MSISTILLAVAVVVEFIAAVRAIKQYDEAVKLYNEAVKRNEWLTRENGRLKHNNEALVKTLVNTRRQISKFHKRNRRSGKHGNI
jgi:hypothetical protein